MFEKKHVVPINNGILLSNKILLNLSISDNMDKS